MSTLLDLIDADAEARLRLPPGCAPPDEVERYQRFLRLENHRLRLAHRRGASGRQICQGLARVWDRVFGSLLQAAQAAGSASGVGPVVALVATGGYGRGELSPASDIELLILHEGHGGGEGARLPVVEWLASPALTGLFPRVGVAVRTVAECIPVANADLWSKTALLEARLIGGDTRLFAQFRKAILAHCVKGQEKTFIAARLADQEARRAKYGQAVCLQEPHIKSGCGGLRDYQSLLWLAFFKYRSRTLAELEARGLIIESERVQLEAAYDFLLRVRNEAHGHAGRAADVLTKSIQPFVARGLGYLERSLSRRLERFMRDYFRQARTVHLLTRTIAERLALLPPPRGLPSLRHWLRKRRPRAVYVVDDFEFVDGRIHAATPLVFRRDSSRLMRVFRHAQQRGLALDPGLAQLVRQEVTKVGAAFRSDPRVHQTFLEVLNQRGNVAPILRSMHEVGLLGAYLPPFGKLTCLVQHEFFHQYTADEHTLVCLEKLDEIAAAKNGPWSAYGEILTKSVERPYLLYLALLLHDAGKARPTSDHAEDGSRMAASVAKRLGLDAASAGTLRLLVRHHLAMVTVSQRRDLDEPAEIRRFAALVGTVDRLNLLTLLTIADSLGTSDRLWNGFKNSLLMTLYWRTREVLTRGPEFIQAESRQRERVASEVRRLLTADFPTDEIGAHFDRMPARYFLLREARAIVADLELTHRFLARALSEDEDPLEPVALWQHAPDRGYSVVRVVTWDRAGLFSRVCGALTAAGLNILSAEIFTRDDSIAIDTFSVVDASRGALADTREQEQFARYLREAVCVGVDLRDAIHAHPQSQPIYEHAGLDPIPTVIRFDNQSADTRTVLEVETRDRVGLLYAITQVLWALRLDISVAKICTERGAASDGFYLCEADGSKIEAPARQKGIEDRLRAAIKALA